MQNMLPSNPNCKINTLPNGLTTYIQHNDTPKNRVVLRLVVKKGSMQEDENERGLAHFLEHCAFRATENYPDGQLIHYLQSLGSAFGPDVNAATSLTHTIYKLTIPTTTKDDTSSLREALKVLAEWAFRIRIAQKDVEAERNVIMEEWRGRQGASNRMLYAYWNKIFDKTKWSKRMPIGLVEIIQNCTASDIQTFYNKHYEPKHMGLVIVGDFKSISSSTESLNVINDIENMIKELFLTPKKPTEHIVKPFLTEKFPFPHHNSPVICVVEDTEYRRANMSLEYFDPIQPVNNMDFLKKELHKRVVTSALDNRLRLIVKNMVEFKNDNLSTELKNTILTAGVSLNSVVPGLNRFSITLRLSEAHGSQKFGVNVLAREVIRLISHGFTQEEIDIAKRKWISAFKAQKNNVNQLTSNSIVSDCVEHFLSDFQSIFAGTETELNLSLEEMNKVMASDINTYVQELFPLPNFNNYDNDNNDTKDMSSTIPGKFQALTIQRGVTSNDTKFDESQLRHLWYDSLKHYHSMLLNDQLERWPEENKNNSSYDENNMKTTDEIKSNDGKISLLSKEQKRILISNKGSIVNKKYLKSSDAYEWTLSNGIKIIWKRTDFQKEKFSFQGFCLGGKSGLSEEDHVVFGFIDDVATESGLGEFNGNYINNLSHTNTRVNTQQHLLFKGIGGSGMNNENAELLFQMLYLKLTNQPFDGRVLENVTGRYKQLLSSSEKSAEYEFLQSIKRTMYGDDVPAFQELTVDKINKFVSLENMKSLFEQEFMNNNDQFTFSFCGDLPDNDVFEEYVMTYLGQFNGTHKGKKSNEKKQGKCIPTQIDILPPKEIEVHKSMKRALTDKCDAMVVFNMEVPSQNETVEFASMAKVFAHIATTKLRKEIRENRSGVYNIVMDVDYSSLAKHALFIVQFSCDPENSDELVEHVHVVLKKLLTGNFIEEEDIQTTKTILTKQHELRLKNNSNWLFWLLDSKKMENYVSILKNDHLTSDSDDQEWLEKHLYKRHQGHIDFINNVTKEHILSFSNSLLDLKKYRVFLLLPKGKMKVGGIERQGIHDVIDNTDSKQMPLSSLAIEEQTNVDEKVGSTLCVEKTGEQREI